MLKKITLFLASTLAVFATNYTLDRVKLEIHHDAKKDQFFNTYLEMVTVNA